VRYRHIRDLAWQAVGPETVVLDLARGRSLGLNATAGLVWTLLPDHDHEEIAAEVARRYDIALETARSDVTRLVDQLLERGLIESA
jgi:hypothetical protein